MKRLLGSILLCLPVLVTGCGPLEGLLGGKPVGIAARATGQWQKTVIAVQKYNNALLRDKKTGRVLDPEDARDMPLDAYTVEIGDSEELTYRSGRLRYSFFPREKGGQPFVVERAIDEKAFEALDEALYKDKFFAMPATNWATERFPMFLIQYDQGGKGHKASFTPNLNRLLKTGQIVMPYLSQLSGQAKLPAGTKQYAYYLTVSGGELQIAISTFEPNGAGEPEDRPWKLTAATYDTGKGPQAATIAPGGSALTLPLPAADGALQLLSLKLTAEGAPGTWETLIPFRAAK